MVSKYIGETEKNLDQVFDAARAGNVVLFFDEADALFGKRSEVRDARDRYANIEVSYLLQRLEAYDGIVILATNFEKNIDEAFLRRLHIRIEFTIPDETERKAIWEHNLPAGAPLDRRRRPRVPRPPVRAQRRLDPQRRAAGRVPRRRRRRDHRHAVPHRRRGPRVPEAGRLLKESDFEPYDPALAR